MSSRKLFALFSFLVLVPAVMLAGGGALSLVPDDATTVGMIAISDLRSSPLTSRLFTETDNLSVDGESARFMAEAGLRPSEDVDRVVVAVSPGKDNQPQVVVAFEGRFDAERLGAAVISRGGSKKSSPAGEYFLLPKGTEEDDAGVVSFVDSHLVIAGSEAAVVRALSDRAAGGTKFFERSGLGREFGRIDPSATSWVLVDPQRSARLSNGPQWGDASRGQAPSLGQAMKTVAAIALWATDAKDSLRFGGSAVSYDAETRQLLEDSVRGLVAGWRLAVQDKNPELVPILRGFKIDQTGDSVVFAGSLPADALKNWASKAPAVAKMRTE